MRGYAADAVHSPLEFLAVHGGLSLRVSLPQEPALLSNHSLRRAFSPCSLPYVIGFKPAFAVVLSPLMQKPDGAASVATVTYLEAG